jgi:choline-sulfatase
MATNILVFLTDDHAQWAARCYGNREIRTPTLDHLARSGVCFENAFTPSPVCSPARASFLTGRMPSQHGVHDYLAESDPEVAAVPWLEGETTLAGLLQGSGYFTGLSGKWHLGSKKPKDFDFVYSISAPVSEPDFYAAPWEKSRPPEAGYDRHAVTDKAVEFLRNRSKDQPFFLVVGHIATHSPWSDHPERLVEEYRDCTFDDIPEEPTYRFGRLRSEALYSSRNDPRQALAQYYAAVTEIDEQVGRVIDELDTQGLRNDTLVVYTSDHGLSTGHHGIWGKGNGTLPYNMVDESIRVPLIFNQPGGLLGHQRRNEYVTHCDTFMTILESVGIELPSLERAERNYPGRSYDTALKGQSVPEWDDTVIGEYGNLRMIRTPELKLVMRFPEGPNELFDLSRDPRETTNVYGVPRYADDLLALQSRLHKYFDAYEDPRHSGLDVLKQPRHNGDEAWRDTSEPVLEEDSTWLHRLEASIQARRGMADETAARSART